MMSKMSKKEEKKLVNVLLSQYVAYKHARNYRLALQTLEDVLLVATDEQIIAEVRGEIERFRALA